MNLNRILLASVLVFAYTGLSLSAGAAFGIKYKSSGTFVDDSGGQHPWSLTDAHTLVWENSPYMPVGVVLTPKSVGKDAPEDSVDQDLAVLDAAKSAGITDILLKSPQPISLTNAAAWNKLIEHLESSGMTYGIELGDDPLEPLSGHLVSPNRYRLEGPWAEANIVCDWPHADSAIYVVLNTSDNSLGERGGAIRRDGKLTISLSQPLKSGQILIAYPHRTYPASSESGMADLWGGFGEYRDRLLGFLDQVDFGPGLRFFLEPFSTKMDFTGEMVGFLPDSGGFRVGLEAYLVRRRIHEGSVNSAWGLNETLDSIEKAARLMPMWASGRGLPYAYDRAGATMFSVDVGVSQMWNDIIDFRDQSAQEYMNTIADSLKKQIANVPVIFKVGKHHRIYANPFGMGGYDGLCADALGSGDAPLTRVAGPAYSLAEESGKTNWYISVASEPPAGENALVGLIDSLREVGCKGFYVRLSGSELGTLAGARSRLEAKLAEDFKPTVINFPIAPVTGAYVKRLAPDTWWLPTLRTGKTSYIGDGIFGYTIAGEDRIYLWASDQRRSVTLKSGPSGLPNVEFPTDSQAEKIKGGLFSITLSDSPTVLRGLDFSQVFSFETAQTEIKRLADLIPEVDKQGLDTKQARQQLDSAKRVLGNGQALIAYGMAQASLQELWVLLGDDVWLEGEAARAHNFDYAGPMPGASGALALMLDTDEDPPLTPYSATFAVDVTSNTSYELWVAATPVTESSPVSYTIDNINWTPVAVIDGKSRNYAPGLSWYKIGQTNLFPGKHTVTLRVDGRRSQDNRYYLAIDAVVLSPRGFEPNGIIRPF